MKKAILVILLAVTLPQELSAQTQDNQPGFRNGLPPTTLDSFVGPPEQEFHHQLSAQLAQGQKDPPRAGMVQKLYEFSQDVLSDHVVPVRGGTKNKYLGLYLGPKTKVIFNSDYKDVDPKTQCEWAYDLHQFILENGGGWDNYQKYLKETKPGSLIEDVNENARSYQGGKNPNDPMDRAHVAYDKQAAFADKWWKENSQAYKASIIPPKDWWTNDAVLDGNNLWTRWEMLNGKGSADYSSWRDAELATLLNKK